MAISSGYTAEDLARMGPDALTRKRLMAEALLNDATRQRKIEHPLQGLAQMAEALVGGMRVRNIDQAEKAGQESADSAWNNLFGGSSAASMPAPAAASEMQASAPSNSGGGMDQYRNAIASIESDGSGGYSAVGPTSPKMGRALGRYQVMEANIPQWSKEALGREVTPEEFLSNPQIQDAIFDHKFGGYVNQYGPEGAAQAWFAGPGGVGKLDRKDSLGTSVADYTNKFRKFGGAPTQVASLDASVGMPAPGAAGEMANTSPAVPPLPSTPPTASASSVPGPQQPEMIPGTLGEFLTKGATSSPPPNASGAFPAAPQLAQALIGGTPPSSGGMPGQPSPQALAAVLSNPYTSPDKKRVAQALLNQQIDRQNADYEADLKTRDPKYQQELAKGAIDLRNAQNPPEPESVRALRLRAEAAGLKPGTKEYNDFFTSGGSNAAKPSSIAEYEYAKSQGFPGTLQDWESSKKGGMSVQFDPTTGAFTMQQGANIKPMTEAQSKDAVFATRAEGALTKLEPNANALMETGSAIGSQVPLIGNRLKSEAYQQAEQAGKEFLQAILRKDTGAAITPQETDEYGSVYLPRPGDSEKTLEQKKSSRRRALEALKAGMPPQAILAQEKALNATGDKPAGQAPVPAQEATPEETPPPVPAEVPAGISKEDWPKVWGVMTPEERKLWQN